MKVASEVGINAAREYANWGGEFVDDAFRFGEQPYQVSDDWPGGRLGITGWGALCVTDSPHASGEAFSAWLSPK